jgi:rhodanese-related sulfurtransferase
MQVGELDKSKKYVLHCGSGYRARIAYSVMKAQDFDVQVCLIQADKIPKLKQPFI